MFQCDIPFEMNFTALSRLCQSVLSKHLLVTLFLDHRSPVGVNDTFHEHHLRPPAIAANTGTIWQGYRAWRLWHAHSMQSGAGAPTKTLHLEQQPHHNIHTPPLPDGEAADIGLDHRPSATHVASVACVVAGKP